MFVDELLIALVVLAPVSLLMSLLLTCFYVVSILSSLFLRCSSCSVVLVVVVAVVSLPLLLLSVVSSSLSTKMSRLKKARKMRNSMLWMNSSDLVIVAVVPLTLVVVAVDHGDEVSIDEVDVVVVVMRCL